jgi:hypothetical protein
MAAAVEAGLANKVQIPLVRVLLTHKAARVAMGLLQQLLGLACTVQAAAVAAHIQAQLIRQVVLVVAALEAAAQTLMLVSQPEQ